MNAEHLTEEDICDILESRGNPYHDPTNGRFTSGHGGSSSQMVTKDTKVLNEGFFKYNVPRIGKNESDFISGKILSEFPLLKPSDQKHPFEYGENFYIFSVNDYGGDYTFWYKKKITPRSQSFIRLITRELSGNDE